MSLWPVIVDRLDPATATAIYCEDCDWTGQQDDPGDGPISDIETCPKCGAFSLDYCYEEGVRCAGCRTLAISLPVHDEHGHYCTRAHQLQAEYARSLAGAGR